MALVLIVDVLVYKTSTTLPWLLKLYGFLKLGCIICPIFFVLSKLLLLTLGSLQIDIHFKITCQFIDRRLLGSWFGYGESTGQFGETVFFNNTKSSNLWTWFISPFMYVFLNSFILFTRNQLLTKASTYLRRGNFIGEVSKNL